RREGFGRSGWRTRGRPARGRPSPRGARGGRWRWARTTPNGWASPGAAPRAPRPGPRRPCPPPAPWWVARAGGTSVARVLVVAWLRPLPRTTGRYWTGGADGIPLVSWKTWYGAESSVPIGCQSPLPTLA